MRNKGISLLIPVLFLLMLLLVLGSLLSQEASLSLVEFRDSEHDLTLTPYYAPDSGEYYLFLPSFTREEALKLSHPWYVRTQFSRDVSSLSEGELSEVTVSLPWGEKQTCSLRLVHCSANQTVCLEAQDGVLEDVHADQTQEREIFVTILDAQGQTEHRGSALISGRGNATWGWEKKPYDLKFSDPITAGPFQQTDKLCLLSEYSDFSKMRNSLGYFAGQVLDFPYASPYIYADVYLNGEYLGLYGIATKREYTRHIEEDGIQTVFELSASGKDVAYYTENMQKEIRIHYGDPWLAFDKISAMETALLNQDWDTLYQIIDLPSWARKYAMEELLYNFDMSLTSQYFYLDESGKIYCMLPWDYDVTLYSRFYPYDGTTAECAMSSYWNSPNWLELLLESEQYREALASVLEEDFTPELLADFDQRLADSEAETSGSWRCDILRWNDAYSRSHSNPPDYITQAEYRAQFRSYLTSRLDFLKSLLNNWDDYCRVSLYTQTDGVRELSKLHLILPLGADLESYHERIRLTIATPEGYELLGWFAEDGTPMEEVTTVTGDLSLIGHYRSTENGETP